MTTKKSNAPMKVQKGETTPKTQVSSTPKAEKELSKEELLKKVEELQKQVSATPQSIEEKIEYYKRKQELIARLAILDENQEVLTDKIESLKELELENEFTNENFYLNVEDGGKYSKTAVYTVKNPVIIREVLEFVIDRIKVKRSAIQKEIEQ